ESTSSRWRVLWPDSLVNVLPCIGSHAQRTGWPASVTARRIGRSRSSTWAAPMRLMNVSRPSARSGLRRSHRARASWGVAPGRGVLGGGGGAGRATDRVADPGEERDVRAVELAGALADPEHVRRAVVPVAGERVSAGEGLLVAEHERLVTRPHVGLVELGL